jgi:hypothetical protein
MQITEIDPNKKYVLALPEAEREYAIELYTHLKELMAGDNTILVIYGTEVAVIPADQVVGYTTFEDDKIDDLQAGRELDALIAEKVMGIKCGACLQDGQLEPITMDWREIPHYSTDIAAAWEVVEKAYLVIRPSLLHGSNLQWIAGQLKGVRASGLIEIIKETYTEAETAPLAICKAALRAIGECE